MCDRPGFGDVMGEYVAMRRGSAVATGCHELVWVRGADAVSFLDGILSQDIETMEPGAVGRSFLLQPQGKLRALLWALRGRDEVGLVCDAGRGMVVVEDLNRFRFRVDVSIEDPVPVVTVFGPGGSAVLREAGTPVPEGGWERNEEVVVAAAGLHNLPRFFVAGIDVTAITAAGATRVGGVAVTAVRIEAGEAVAGVDVDDSTIPQEAGPVESFVSFAKGCYLGQELVARIDSRGRVNRHLRGLQISENVLPPAGADVVHGDSAVGTVTSVSESPTLRAPVALAMIRREVAPGDSVNLSWPGGGTTATVHELPMDDFASP